MFCEFCGKKIDPKKRACPYCGQQQTARSGGNGFWDILSPQAATERVTEMEQKPPIEPHREPNRDPSKNGRKRKNRFLYQLMSILILIMLLLSIALNIFAFRELLHLKQDIDTLKRDIDQRIKTLEIKNEETEPTESVSPAVENSQPTPAPTTDKSNETAIPEITEESQTPTQNMPTAAPTSPSVSTQPTDNEAFF